MKFPEMMQSQVRLYAILARKSPLAVVLRRGPSNRVLLVQWNTSNDTFEYGQWLKGRIYERRCDLSPEGGLLLYFAANFRKPYYSWSAISRPPYLTALALWPKGDCWGGGGHFVTRKLIHLSHRAPEMALAQGFTLPRWMKVKPFGDRPGWGEDDPVWMLRLQRDGWNLVRYPTGSKDDSGARVMHEFDPPITWQKANPIWPGQYQLEMAITGIQEKNGPWYLVEHAIIRGENKIDKIGRSDWADWSHTGDLLFALDGSLYRLRCRSGVLGDLEDAERIVDLSQHQFEALRSPEHARRWPRK